jgi:hypothetical protein
MKFGLDQKFELKKSIKLWQWPEQKLLKHFVHFAGQG